MIRHIELWVCYVSNKDHMLFPFGVFLSEERAKKAVHDTINAKLMKGAESFHHVSFIIDKSIVSGLVSIAASVAAIFFSSLAIFSFWR